MAKLYHYTMPSWFHLHGILRDGVIERTASELSLHLPHEGPPVVWLTDSADPKAQRWARPPDESLPADGVSKTAAMLTIDLPEDCVFHWPAWSREHGIEEEHYRALADTGGDPGSWWVTTTPIPRENIIELVIAPIIVEGVAVPMRQFAGADLRRLFDSASTRNALALAGNALYEEVV